MLSASTSTMVSSPVFNKLDQVLNVLTDAIVCTDSCGKVIWANVMFARLMQQTVADLMSTDLIQLLSLEQDQHPVALIDHPVTIARTQKTCGQAHYSLRIREEEKSLAVSWFHLYPTDQEPMLVLAMRDLSKHQAALSDLEKHRQYRSYLEKLIEERTASMVLVHRELQRESRDRLRAEIALQESEARFRNLVEQTYDWVWEVDCNAIFTYTNPRVKDILGYEPGEILGQAMFDFMVNDEAKRFTTIWQFAIAHRDPFNNFEKRLFHKGGHLLVLETNASPILNIDGSLQGYRGITRDITERKQIEHETRKALSKERELNDLKSRFITTASHEFRTPLAIISSSTGILENFSARLGEVERHKHLSRIQTSVQHIVQLLDDLLAFDQSKAAPRNLAPIPLDLVQFCQTFVQDLQQQTPLHTIVFSNHSMADCQQLPSLDPSFLSPMLTHLLSNAIKFSPQSAAVYLDLIQKTDTVVLKIRDTGIGIPASDLKRIFDPFYRASNAENIPGTGMGLSIVKNYIECHGGTIQVTSKLGSGTTASVILPCLLMSVVE